MILSMASHIINIRGGSSEFVHPQLGRIKIRCNARSRRISARWIDGCVVATAPCGVTGTTIYDALTTMAPRLLARKPRLTFSAGQRLDFPFVSFIIEPQSDSPGMITSRRLASGPLRIGYWHREDLTSSLFTAKLSSFMSKTAASIAGSRLLSHAARIAGSLKASPTGWEISHGHRTLGSCNSAGRILLSRYLLFMPIELVDYVVMHELAHLTHMDHSPRFHALLNQYCNGNEKALARKLKSYVWPISR